MGEVGEKMKEFESRINLDIPLEHLSEIVCNDSYIKELVKE